MDRNGGWERGGNGGTAVRHRQCNRVRRECKSYGKSGELHVHPVQFWVIAS